MTRKIIINNDRESIRLAYLSITEEMKPIFGNPAYRYINDMPDEVKETYTMYTKIKRAWDKVK